MVYVMYFLIEFSSIANMNNSDGEEEEEVSTSVYNFLSVFFSQQVERERT